MRSRKPTHDDRAKLLSVLLTNEDALGNAFYVFNKMTDDPKLAAMLHEAYTAGWRMYYDAEIGRYVDSTYERILRAVQEKRLAWNWEAYELDCRYEASLATVAAAEEKRSA